MIEENANQNPGMPAGPAASNSSQQDAKAQDGQKNSSPNTSAPSVNETPGAAGVNVPGTSNAATQAAVKRDVQIQADRVVAALAADSGRQQQNPRSRYADFPHITGRQREEGVALSIMVVAAVGLTAVFWHYWPEKFWAWAVLAGLAGVIGGLLHSLKWFYRTVSRGQWEWDMVWWRFQNPLVSGVMAFSIYILFYSGVSHEAPPEHGPLTAYSIGFLTGLFADNAMGKLRDIAYALFGQVAPPPSKPLPKTPAQTDATHNPSPASPNPANPSPAPPSQDSANP